MTASLRIINVEIWLHPNLIAQCRSFVDAFVHVRSLKRESFQMMATPRQSLPSFKKDLCGSRLVRTTMTVVWSKFVNYKNSDGASMSLCVFWIYVVLERVARIKLKMSSENKMKFVIASHLNRALDIPFATNGWNGENLLLYPFGAIILHITYLQSKLYYPTFVPPKKVFKKGGQVFDEKKRIAFQPCEIILTRFFWSCVPPLIGLSVGVAVVIIFDTLSITSFSRPEK